MTILLMIVLVAILLVTGAGAASFFFAASDAKSPHPSTGASARESLKGGHPRRPKGVN